MDDKSTSSSRKSPKKVYQPFGTANHSKHAFSEFAHLDPGSRSFATGIASTKEHVIGPEPEEEEQPKKRRPASRKAKKPQQQQKKTKEDGQEGEESVDEEKNDEEFQPCTKIPCQQVLRAIAELELKNEGERLDLEDEADRLTQDLQQSMQEIIQSEARLAKLNELGDQLEMAVNKILSQVEALEQKNQSLVDERTEINSKLMLLEVERQKQNRKLEKVMKQVTDARWRKKKKAQQQDAENGLSYPPSEISEHKIIQKDSETVKRDLDVTFTKYNSLARDQVVDYLERPPTLKTVHPVLAEDFLVNYPQEFDKYAQRHYRQQISTSIESWESIQDTTVACDVRKHPKYPQYHQQQQPSPSQTRDSSPSHTMFQSASLSTISKHTPSLQSLKKPLSTISKTGPGMNHPETPAQQRVGQTLSSQVSREVQHRRQLVDTMHGLVNMVQQNPHQVKGPGFKLPPSAAATVFHDPDALKLERPVSPTSRPTTRDPNSDQSLSGDRHSMTASVSGSMGAASSALSRRLNYKPKFEKKTKGAGLQLSKSQEMVSLSGSGKIRLTPLNINGPSSNISDSGFGLQLGHLMDHDQQEEEYLEKMEQDGIFLPTLGQSPEPVGHNSSGILSSSSFYSNTGPSEQKPRIDDVFYKATSQTQWGRGHKLGEVRSKPPNNIIHTVVHPITEHSGDTGGKQQDSQIKKKAPKITYKTVSGLTIVDMRQLPRLHARTLTVEHPGMPTFESAQDLFAGGPGGVAPADESTSRTK